MPFAFVHIPKTAGRAFAGIIEKHTAISVAPHLLMGHYYTLPVDGYDFYRGHTFLCAMEEIMPGGTGFMTLLRDPVNRAYSHWRHISQNVNWRMYGVERPLSFSQFIRHPNTRSLASNFQLRYLTLCPDPDTITAHKSVLEWQHRYEQSAMPDRNWQRILCDIALEKLSKFAMVGTQEKFSSAVMAACLAMGYSPPPWVQTVEADYRYCILEEDFDFLMENNTEDWRLYNAYR